MNWLSKIDSLKSLFSTDLLFSIRLMFWVAPRKRQIKRKLERFVEDITENGIQVLPIVGNQVLYQSAIDSISGQVRKIIISNATVSSIVGSNIRYVIDSGFESLLVFNTKSGIKEVLKAPASTETASNRAKNAGLNGPGKCFRLYTQTDHKSGPKNVPITNW